MPYPMLWWQLSLSPPTKCNHNINLRSHEAWYRSTTVLTLHMGYIKISWIVHARITMEMCQNNMLPLTVQRYSFSAIRYVWWYHHIIWWQYVSGFSFPNRDMYFDCRISIYLDTWCNVALLAATIGFCTWFIALPGPKMSRFNVPCINVT